ncbi:hypothetical protein [uncultured Gammaproteobacteria bacterium]|nr:hypothetical protein [uncultured Gammaproteobacteria bacterium]
MLGVFPRHFGCFIVVLDGCYFIRLVVFWLGYAKVSSNLFKNEIAIANFCCADRLFASPIIFISNLSK